MNGPKLHDERNIFDNMCTLYASGNIKLSSSSRFLESDDFHSVFILAISSVVSLVDVFLKAVMRRLEFYVRAFLSQGRFHFIHPGSETKFEIAHKLLIS